MSIIIKRKEPPNKVEPIESVATGDRPEFHVKFFPKPSRETIGISFGRDDGGCGSFYDEAFGRTELTIFSARELANAILEMADQIEGK